MKKVGKWLLVIAVISVLSWDITCFAKVYFSDESAEKHLGSKPKTASVQSKAVQISWPKTLEKFAGLGEWELKEKKQDSAVYFYERGDTSKALGRVIGDSMKHPGADEYVFMKISFAPNAVKNAKNYRGQMLGKCASNTKFYYYLDAKKFDSRAELADGFFSPKEDNEYRIKGNPYGKGFFSTVVFFRPAKYNADVKVGFVHPEGVELVYKICQGIDPLLEKILIPNKIGDEMRRSLGK